MAINFLSLFFKKSSFPFCPFVTIVRSFVYDASITNTDGASTYRSTLSTRPTGVPQWWLAFFTQHRGFAYVAICLQRWICLRPPFPICLFLVSKQIVFMTIPIITMKRVFIIYFLYYYFFRWLSFGFFLPALIPPFLRLPDFFVSNYFPKFTPIIIAA